MSRISALKNKISRLEIEVSGLKNRYSAKYVAALDKEIIALKQEGQCKQIIIDGLHYKLDRSGKALKNAYGNVARMDKLIKDSEDKKIKNRLRKLLLG
ncbi:hypothetical protein [Clostridium sp. CF012]|uniref:hypothetical protein n=1 Tax=Clostridium sp. CF012 TaxID=2843319 RepID=UPI001C0CDF4E|nr:hypothetical protein [Clostridium sp. CF012]MBU3146610.1 hypothetical protein [Clostridium sp. CF012]